MRLIAVFVLILSACTPQVSGRGHLDAPKKVEQLTPGSSHKQDVVRILGTPSTRSSFGEEIWYYISAKKESYAFFKPEITEQKVIAVAFDTNGMVSAVKTFDKDDAQDVATVDKVTPTEGQELGLWEQLLGNIGRFNKAGDGGGTAGPVGGGPGR